MTIENARKARAEQSLDKHVRLSTGEILTRRAFMDRLRSQDGRIVVRQERNEAAEEKLRRDIEGRERGWSLPIGNPCHPETIAYMALKDRLKAGVFKEKTYVELPSGSFFEVSKAEADYFARVSS